MSWASVKPYLLTVLAGFLGMALYALVEIAWTDHTQVEANREQAETNQTQIAAIVTFLQQRAGAILPPALQPEPEEEEGEPTP